MINSKDIRFNPNTGTKVVTAPALRSEVSSAGQERSSDRGKAAPDQQPAKASDGRRQTVVSEGGGNGEEGFRIYFNEDEISAFNGTDELTQLRALSDAARLVLVFLSLCDLRGMYLTSGGNTVSDLSFPFKTSQCTVRQADHTWLVLPHYLQFVPELCEEDAPLTAGKAFSASISLLSGLPRFGRYLSMAACSWKRCSIRCFNFS